MTNDPSLPPPVAPEVPSGRNPWKIFSIAVIVLAVVGGAVAAGYFLGSSDDGGAGSSTSASVTSTTTIPASSTTSAATTTEVAPTTTRAQRQLADAYRELFESWRTDIPDLYRLYDSWEAFRGEDPGSPEIRDLYVMERVLCQQLAEGDLTFDYGRQTYGSLDNFMSTGIDLSAEQNDKVSRYLIAHGCPDRLR